MDILPHPVCPEAVPAFGKLMDDRIHLATVDGVPDPSFLVAPVDLLPRLCSRTKPSPSWTRSSSGDGARRCSGPA